MLWTINNKKPFHGWYQIDVRNTTIFLSYILLDARIVCKNSSILVSILFRSIFFLRFFKRICFSFLCASVFFEHAPFKEKSAYFISFADHGLETDLLAYRPILRTSLGCAHSSLGYHQSLSCQFRGKHASTAFSQSSNIWESFI